LVNLYLFLLSCCVFTVDTLLFFLPENVLVGCGGGHPPPNSLSLWRLHSRAFSAAASVASKSLM